MYSDPERGTIENSDEEKMNSRLKNLTYMTIVLGIARIVSLDIMLMISDLLTALMIYFYSQSKNKCMPIFCMINGVIGIIYALVKFFPAWSLAKAHWFSFYQSLIVIIALYAIVVYSFICYLSYLGIVKYEMGFGFGSLQNYPQQSSYGVSSNYGAISTGQNNDTKFAAFSGKGTTLG